MLAFAPTVEHLLTVGLGLLLAFSLNLLLLSLGRLVARRTPPGLQPLDEHEMPAVLVQIPVYNEGELVQRILAAVMAFDWPRERLYIQILDDSTDDSLAISRAAVSEARERGFEVELLHRHERTAFKAGALAAGLEQSAAPFVAIFDADFIPPADFLRRTVAVLQADSRLAYVQTRWDHLNPEHNLLTRAQARLLDAHFKVEQEARRRLGLPVPFNGTCGLWRRAAIEDAGGWHGDTLTEDLDLSLRAHLSGWRSTYLGDVRVPGLLPISARAWRTQQFRWTKGFAQCFFKLMPSLWASSLLAPWKKLMISLQLAQPLAFLVGMACLLLSLPLITGVLVAGPALAAIAAIASAFGLLAPLLFLMLGTEGQSVWRFIQDVPLTLAFTSGLLLSNARAGLEAVLGHRSDFVRTPKNIPALTVRQRGWRQGLPELAFGAGLISLSLLEQPSALLFLALPICGLVGLGGLQFVEGSRTLRSGRPV
ncbi:MAG: glycosyltransferase [Chromatiaceae bacterium]|nr:glycosyltransferase [Chromatiaceae bacterium]